jgi:hypothetical protein
VQGQLFDSLVPRFSLKYIKEALRQIEANRAELGDSEEASVLEMLLTKDNLTQDDVLLLILDLLMAGIDTVRSSHPLVFIAFVVILHF